MNTPLLFINTPSHINNDKSQCKYDSRITDNFSFSPFEKQIKDLAIVYGNGVRILVELTTNNKIYVGHVTKYERPFIVIKDEKNVYKISINDMQKLNVVKIGV